MDCCNSNENIIVCFNELNIEYTTINIAPKRCNEFTITLHKKDCSELIITDEYSNVYVRIFDSINRMWKKICIDELTIVDNTITFTLDDEDLDGLINGVLFASLSLTNASDSCTTNSKKFPLGTYYMSDTNGDNDFLAVANECHAFDEVDLPTTDMDSFDHIVVYDSTCEQYKSVPIASFQESHTNAIIEDNLFILNQDDEAQLDSKAWLSNRLLIGDVDSNRLESIISENGAYFGGDIVVLDDNTGSYTQINKDGSIIITNDGTNTSTLSSGVNGNYIVSDSPIVTTEIKSEDEIISTSMKFVDDYISFSEASELFRINGDGSISTRRVDDTAIGDKWKLGSVQPDNSIEVEINGSVYYVTTTAASVDLSTLIQNQIAAPQSSANFWIDGRAIVGSTSDLGGYQLQVDGTSHLNGDTIIAGNNSTKLTIIGSSYPAMKIQKFAGTDDMRFGSIRDGGATTNNLGIKALGTNILNLRSVTGDIRILTDNGTGAEYRVSTSYATVQDRFGETVRFGTNFTTTNAWNEVKYKTVIGTMASEPLGTLDVRGSLIVNKSSDSGQIFQVTGDSLLDRLLVTTEGTGTDDPIISHINPAYAIQVGGLGLSLRVGARIGTGWSAGLILEGPIVRLRTPTQGDHTYFNDDGTTTFFKGGIQFDNFGGTLWKLHEEQLDQSIRVNLDGDDKYLATTDYVGDGFIQNQITSPQTSSNFWIDGIGKADGFCAENYFKIENPEASDNEYSAIAVFDPDTNRIQYRSLGDFTNDFINPNDFIQNQIATDQVANMRISGTGIFGGGADSGETLQVNGDSLFNGSTTLGLGVQSNALYFSPETTSFNPRPGLFYDANGWYVQVPNNGKEIFSFKLGSTSSNRQFNIVDNNWNQLFSVQGDGTTKVKDRAEIGFPITTDLAKTLQVEGNSVFNGLVSQTGLGFSTYFGEGAGINDDLSNNFNTGFGFRALNSVVDSTSNVGIGYQTLSDGDGISSNVGIGYQALKSLNNASSNTAIGTLSMSNKMGGNDNTAIGRGSQTNNLLASFNTSVGKESLEVVGNNSNTALGYRAARYLDNSQLNIAIGHSSLLTNITTPFLGYQNIALGTSAMRDAVDGSTQVYQNIAIGTESLRYSVGLNTVSIGYYAGREVVVGGNNTKSNNSLFLGALTKPEDINQTNQIVIGHLAEGKGSNTVTIGNSSITHNYLTGKLLLDTVVDTGETLQVEGNTVFRGLVSQTGLGDSTYFGEGAGINDDLSNNRNTGFGYESLTNLTTGRFNVAIGYLAGTSLINSDYNTMIGTSSGSNTTFGLGNSFIGYVSGVNNIDGDYNVSIGSYSMSIATNNVNMVTIGANSGYYSLNSSDSTIIGFDALGGNVSNPNSVDGVVSIGRGNMQLIGAYSTLVRRVTSIGTYALRYSGGDFNVAIGYDAGSRIIDGNVNTKSDNSTFIGYQTKPQDINQTNQIVIGYLAEGKGSNTVTIGNDSITHNYLTGKLLVSKTSDDGQTLQVLGNAHVSDDIETKIFKVTRSDGFGTPAEITQANGGNIQIDRNLQFKNTSFNKIINASTGNSFIEISNLSHVHQVSLAGNFSHTLNDFTVNTDFFNSVGGSYTNILGKFSAGINNTGSATFKGLVIEYTDNSASITNELIGIEVTLSGTNTSNTKTAFKSLDGGVDVNGTLKTADITSGGLAQPWKLGDIQVDNTVEVEINGTVTYLSTLASLSGDFIQNQNSAAQSTSNFWIDGTGRIDETLTFTSGDSKGIRILKDDGVTVGTSIYNDSTQDYSRFEAASIWTAVTNGQEIIRLIGATANPKLVMSNDITFSNTTGDKFEIDQTGRIGMGITADHPTGFDISLNGITYTDQLLINKMSNTGEQLQVGGNTLIEGVLEAGTPSTVAGNGHKIGAFNIDYQSNSNPIISAQGSTLFVGDDLSLRSSKRLIADSSSTLGLQLYVARADTDFSVMQRPGGVDTITFNIDGATKQATFYDNLILDDGLLDIDSTSGQLMSLKRTSVSGSSWGVYYNGDSSLQFVTPLGGSFLFRSAGNFEILNGGIITDDIAGGTTAQPWKLGDIQGDDTIQVEINGVVRYLSTTLSTTGVSQQDVDEAPFIKPVSSNTANYTLTASDFMVDFDTTSGSLTGTLPTAVGKDGQHFILSNSGTNDLVVDTTSSELINTATSILISSGNSIRVASNGTKWIIV